MKMNANQLLELLEQQHIPCIVRQHRPIYTVAEGLALGLPEIEAAGKSLFITDAKRQSFYLAVLPLDKRLDLKRLRALLQSRRLTMAAAQEVQAMLDVTPGAVTPLALLGSSQPIAVILDEALQGRTVAIPLDGNTQTVWLPCGALEKLLAQSGYAVQYAAL